jgi:hypothetical protein
LLNGAVGLWLTLATGLPSLAFDPPPGQGPAAAAMNEAPAWMVRVAVDRQDRAYVVGEDVNIQAISEQPGYLYLFNIDAASENTLLFPNRFRPDNRIPARSVIRVPGPAGFRIRVGPRGLGTETLLAVVTKRPLEEMRPEDFSREGPTPLRGDQLERLLAEATLGRRDVAGGLREARSDLRRRDPQGYARRSREWAEHSIQIRTAPSRGSGQPQRVGLIVGISRYPSLPEKEQLRFAHRDAQRVAEAARRVGRFARGNLLIDAGATLQKIRAAFQELVASTRPGDTVLIFWSGHGGRVKTDNPARPFIYYLLPYDSDPQTFFHEDELGRWVQALDGRKVMVVIDACFSGGHIEGAKTGTRESIIEVDPRTQGPDPGHFLDTILIRSRSIGQHDAAVLTACRLDQTSLESPSLRSGVLTYFFVDVLRATPGPLTLEDVYRRLDPGVSQHMHAMGKEGQQTPVFSDQTPRPPALIRP